MIKDITTKGNKVIITVEHKYPVKDWTSKFEFKWIQLKND